MLYSKPKIAFNLLSEYPLIITKLLKLLKVKTSPDEKQSNFTLVGFNFCKCKNDSFPIESNLRI